ncbi:MAG: glycosyltransferase family 4 protein [Bacteroidales bacterium]|nr:glycosyltransferase family 4 protein [Bacteroidales bacterium]
MQKQKLVYIIPSLEIGGAEVALMSAVSELNKSFDFRLVCLGSCNHNLIAGLSESERKNIIFFKRFPFNYFKALFYVLKFKPNVIVTSLWKATPIGILTRLIRPKTAYAEFIHNSIYFHFFDKLFTKLALKSADVVFCDSISAKKFVKKQGVKKPIEIISFLRFQSSKQWNSKLSISLKALFIGRFHEQKRIDRLVTLVKKLNDEGLNFEVDLFGRDDGTMDLVKNLIKENQLEENIFLKGEIASSKVQELFSSYDFYFQTSEVEGMAMSVVEAMQHGLICVLTNVGEIRNYAKNGENAVIISDDFNLTPTIEQLKKIVSDIDLANKVSENAHSTFANQKDFASSLVETINKYR